MTGYVSIKHPITGGTIQAVATGRTDGSKAEVLIITPGSNLPMLWIERGDILAE